MCNRYKVEKDQAALRAAFEADWGELGNLPPPQADTTSSRANSMSKRIGSTSSYR